MHPQSATALTTAMKTAAKTAGLTIISIRTGTDFHGGPTTGFTFGLQADTTVNQTLQLELSQNFDFQQALLLPEMTKYLAEAALRLRNPRPDCYVTLAGLPIRFEGFAWPFHLSTSGADTYVVHGVARLEDGEASPLHAKVAASMTVTFADIVPAPEQPYAETFIYNAIRKTLDQGQMEMIKSGNRQPVPVTTRYYSRWRKTFVFTDTSEETRMDFLALKLYWLSGVLGGGAACVDCRSSRCAVSQHGHCSTAAGRRGTGSGRPLRAEQRSAIRFAHGAFDGASRAVPPDAS